jgi:DNA-binding transcriptional ArsR family regulator
MPEVKQMTNSPVLRLDPTEMKKHARQAVGLIKGLANENRLMVMCVLCAGELSVGELNARIKLSQSALSQHLAILRQQGLVQTRREGQTIYYSLRNSAALRIIQTLHDEFCRV